MVLHVLTTVLHILGSRRNRTRVSAAIVVSIAPIVMPILSDTMSASGIEGHHSRLSGPQCGAWSVVDSPSSGIGEDQLTGVSALSSGDVWAVGDYYNENAALLTQVEHWDGSAWTIVPSPSPGGTGYGSVSVLSGVTALAPNDVWAVGYFSTADGYIPITTLVEHWDGTSWNVVPSPNPGKYPPANGQLSAVTASSPSDVWAVGEYDNNRLGFSQTLIEHWNGSTWKIVRSPNSGDNDVLNAVSAASPTAISAVGYYTPGSQYSPSTLAVQWNGRKWRVVRSPNPSAEHDVLNGVAADSSTSAWAVGFSGLPSVDQATLTAQWDGAQWSVVSSPNVGTEPTFSAVVAASSSNVWAVGQDYQMVGGTDVLDTLTAQWNGAS